VLSLFFRYVDQGFQPEPIVHFSKDYDPHKEGSERPGQQQRAGTEFRRSTSPCVPIMGRPAPRALVPVDFDAPIEYARVCGRSRHGASTLETTPKAMVDPAWPGNRFEHR